MDEGTEEPFPGSFLRNEEGKKGEKQHKIAT